MRQADEKHKLEIAQAQQQIDAHQAALRHANEQAIIERFQGDSNAMAAAIMAEGAGPNKKTTSYDNATPFVRAYLQRVKQEDQYDQSFLGLGDNEDAFVDHVLPTLIAGGVPHTAAAEVARRAFRGGSD